MKKNVMDCSSIFNSGLKVEQFFNTTLSSNKLNSHKYDKHVTGG
jgi:hypothetical protein